LRTIGNDVQVAAIPFAHGYTAIAPPEAAPTRTPMVCCGNTLLIASQRPDLLHVGKRGLHVADERQGTRVTVLVSCSHATVRSRST
jgi:hypothetical protein